MNISVFDMFRVGIGPSSSHTVGPLRAGAHFAQQLQDKGYLEAVTRLNVRLMGSLAATGQGHGTDRAAMLGLMGKTPEGLDPDEVESLLKTLFSTGILSLQGLVGVPFKPAENIEWLPDVVCAYHTNALEFMALGAQNEVLYRRRYYSIGGGFIRVAQECNPDLVEDEPVLPAAKPEPYPFDNATELMAQAQSAGLSIADIIRANEGVRWSATQIDEKLDSIWQVMSSCLARGFRQSGYLPGPFHIARRAKKMKESLESNPSDPWVALDWVNAYAFAVSEENAAGGRVVTAPTNGAAGVIPAVIQYYIAHVPGASAEKVRDFLLTAGAVGMIFKHNASISGAEVGCQGEVGVACSMAAAGLCAVLGGTATQIENAAEIGMEHNLGLTCDPVAGQVQIPCIERNAVAAVKAINAARMALRGNGSHYISLDQVVEAMFETGRDMQEKYKETSRGGLAIRLVQC